MRWSCLALLAVVGLGQGCRKASPAAGHVAPATSAVELGVLPSRPEAVAHADHLAVQGSKSGGERGAALTLTAAELRARLWRLEGREADALEAVELYRGVEQSGAPSACDARLDRALLEGELRADPAETYRAVYQTRVAHPKTPCAKRAGNVLDALAAFRPLPNVLAELERKVGSPDGATSDEGASAATVKHDPAGPVVVPTLAGAVPKGPVRITRIEKYGAKDAARVVVFINQPATFDVGFIGRQDGRGPRLYVDVDKAKYKGALEMNVGGLVERVRIGKHKSATRVVLDLTTDVYRKVFYLPEPFRLVIDVSKTPPQQLAQGAEASRTIHRVVLDPGHGGHDPGAIGPSGLREKDVTLDIAHRAAPLIARELGVATLLTRDSDDFIPLDERAARANAFKADLFVSIHCNASEDENGHGVMTFVLDESRDQGALRVAARENAASPAAAAELANALSQVADASSTARSVHFAELLQRAASASLQPKSQNVSDHGVKRAGFYVLAGARMPAVLFETSFISNPVEESRLNTGDYRQKLADSVVNAIRAYREGR